jgi:outer membrane protein OmpA-like peptidoglycan-associated protein
MFPAIFLFDTGQSTIKPEMLPVLNSLAAGLKSNSNSQATIIGYTDDTGNDSINNPLSVNRAASTRAYLVSQGIAFNRISIDGRGASEPVAANTSPENRAKNRRVEIFVKEPQPQQQRQQELPQHQDQQQYIQQPAY